MSVELILAAIGAAAAIAAAVFSFPPFRDQLRRPRLVLRVRGRAVSNQATPEWRRIGFQLELHNAGKAWARAWRVKIRTPDGLGTHGRLELPPGLPNAPGQNQHVMGDGRYIVEWWSMEEMEAVPPGQDHPLPTACEAVVRGGETLAGEYMILAERFAPKEGTIEVRDTGDGSAIVRVR